MNLKPNIIYVSLMLLLLGIGCSPLMKKGPSKRSNVSAVLGNEEYDPNCPIFLKEIDYCAEFRPLESPIPVRRSTQFSLAFWDRMSSGKNGPFSNPMLVPYVWLWMEMPTGSHGSAAVDVSQGTDLNGAPKIGEYQVSNLIFSMRGEWQLHLELHDSAGVVFEYIIKLNI